jgi:hypothetical protein
VGRRLLNPTKIVGEAQELVVDDAELKIKVSAEPVRDLVI